MPMAQFIWSPLSLIANQHYRLLVVGHRNLLDPLNGVPIPLFSNSPLRTYSAPSSGKSRLGHPRDDGGMSTPWVLTGLNSPEQMVWHRGGFWLDGCWEVATPVRNNMEGTTCPLVFRISRLHNLQLGSYFTTSKGHAKFLLCSVYIKGHSSRGSPM
jgi:hypothetical protein